MFEDICTRDMTLDKEEKEAGFALLTKYLVKNIDSINKTNIKEHVATWIASMLDDGVDHDQVMNFKEHLRGYIPDALY